MWLLFDFTLVRLWCVEGLNVITVLNVIKFGPKCNKVLNVTKFSPKCNNI